MSATISNSSAAQSTTNEIWSRSGSSFGRLVWKEFSEAIGVWSVIAIGTLCCAAMIDRRAIESLPTVLLHAAPAIFALLYGARTFAQEIANGTWEFLKSAGAPARDVVGSKWLVGVSGSVLMMGLSITLASALRLPLLMTTLGEPTLWYLLVVLLTLALALHVSQRSRSVWKGMALSGVLCLPLWGAWAWEFEHFTLLTREYRWFSNAVLSLAIVALPAICATQVWAARWHLLDHAGQSGSQRWWRVFWRMVWKELLSARDFWLAVLGIVVLLDGVAWQVFRDLNTRDTTLVVIGVLMPILHALGCGAISFAIEREDGTHDWLRRISAPADAVLAAKFAVSQASIVTLTSLVLLATQCLVQADYRLSGMQGLGLLLVVTLIGVISLGASMQTRRVLPAVFLAFFAVAATTVLVSTFWGLVFATSHRSREGRLGLEGLLPWWLLSGAVMLAIECWLAERWLNERPWWKSVWRGDPAKKVKVRRDIAWFEHSPSPEMKAFGRLLWREWREARVWLWMLPIAFAPWLLNEISRGVNHRPSVGFEWGGVGLGIMMVPLGILSIMLTMLPTLWGLWAIHHDQRQGLFRFLTDRGGSPTAIWSSKHAVWLPQVLLLALTVGMTLGWRAHWTRPPTESWVYVGFALVGALQGYAAGQWIAQLIRSPLTSLFLAGVLSLLLAGFSKLLWEIHAPWPYQVAPAATLLFASWVHSRDWLEERWTWRVWLKIAAAVLLPAAELVLALEVQGYPLWETLRDWAMVH